VRSTLLGRGAAGTSSYYFVSNRRDRKTFDLYRADAATRSVVTSTGRIYRLIGAPGLQGDATYVWKRWVWKWNATVLSDAAPALVQSFSEAEANDADQAT